MNIEFRSWSGLTGNWQPVTDSHVILPHEISNLIVVILASACSKQKEIAMQADVDSLQSTLKAVQQLAVDTSIFISHVMAFEETKEFYVSLYTLGHHQARTSVYIKSQLDSVIYSDDQGTKRTRLPLEVANQYFNLSGLSRITIYTKAGKIVTDATFERVEYLEGMIENEYVAVFKPLTSSWNLSDISYCISSPNTFLNSLLPHEEFKDQAMTSRLVKRFYIDSTKVWKVQHLHFLRDHHIWSVIAVDLGSYIIETKGAGSSIILFELNEEYSVMEIIPLDIEINGKPVLLCTAGVNDTDSMWSTLLVYKPGGYQVMKMGRIES